MTACNSCDVASLDLCTLDNEDFIRSFEVKSQNEAIDLTGWVIEMQVKETFSGAALVSIDSLGATADGSQIVVINAEAGIFEIQLREPDLDPLEPPGDDIRKVFRYDIRFTDPDSFMSVLIRGKFIVERGVTS